MDGPLVWREPSIDGLLGAGLQAPGGSPSPRPRAGRGSRAESFPLLTAWCRRQRATSLASIGEFFGHRTPCHGWQAATGRPFGPTRGSQPGAQAGRALSRGRKVLGATHLEGTRYLARTPVALDAGPRPMPCLGHPIPAGRRSPRLGVGSSPMIEAWPHPGPHITLVTERGMESGSHRLLPGGRCPPITGLHSPSCNEEWLHQASGCRTTAPLAAPPSPEEFP